MLATLNKRLADIPQVGIRQLPRQVSRLLQEVVMTTTASNHLHSNSKAMVVLLLLQITLVTITTSHQLQPINRAKVILRMAMVLGIMHQLHNLVMASQILFQGMISSKAIILQLDMEI